MAKHRVRRASVDQMGSASLFRWGSELRRVTEAGGSMLFWSVEVFGGWGKEEDALRLDAVLEAVELPARVAGLDAGLADVNGDYLTHGC